MKKRLSLLMALVFSVTTFAGFSFSTSANASKAKPEQKIVAAISGEPEQMDPTLNNYSLSSTVLQNLFRGLYKIDANGKPVLALAKSLKIDKSGTIYTFTLKDNLKWNDGKPLTAKDFEYSWKRVLNPKVASATSFQLWCIKNGRAYNEGKGKAEDVGITAVNNNTLKVTLQNPTPWFISLLCTTAFYPVRQDVVEAGKWTTSADTYKCTGPFMISKIVSKQKIVMVKNPYYVDAAKVKLKSLELVFMDASETELAAYINNDIQVSTNVNANGVNKYKSTTEFHSSKKIGVNYYDINTSKKPFNDARVRRAFSISLNRSQLINDILQQPGFKKANGFVPFAVTDPAKTFQDYRVSAGSMFKEDITEAKALLAAAGYANGKGIPDIYLTVKATQVAKDMAQAMQAMWKQNLGVEVKIQTFESKVYWDEVHKGNFSIAADGWTGDYPDPLANLEIFTTDQNLQNNRWSNAEYDKLVAANRKELYAPKRYANFVSMEKLLAKEMPIIPIYFMDSTYLCKPNVKGIVKNYIGHTIFEYAYVE
jgi:oligopeptide transport system substrate-binding protein